MIVVSYGANPFYKASFAKQDILFLGAGRCHPPSWQNLWQSATVDHYHHRMRTRASLTLFLGFLHLTREGKI